MSRWWSSIRMHLKLFLFIFNKSCPLIPWCIIFSWILESFLFLEILHCYSYCLGRKVFVCVYRFWLISELVEVCRSQREREAIDEGSWTTRNKTAGRVLFHFCHLKNSPFSKIEGEFSGSGTPLLDFMSHAVNPGSDGLFSSCISLWFYSWPRNCSKSWVFFLPYHPGYSKLVSVS